ncbi:TonB-dependent receptor [Marinomonas arenicola]|uniref:TonB-dependent receptor n=1 Tax=Marinomonas TaxID=28253 RepID=UPI001055E378|nr:TonB-dependent receptor [Marinomonas sp. KMM3893]
MHHSKKSFSKALPSDLSRIAIAVISVNAAIISPNLLAEDSKTLPNLIVSGEKVDKDIKDTTTAVTVFSEENYESGEVKEVNEIAVQAPNVTSAGFGTINIRGINGAGAATGAEAYATGSKPRIATTVDGVTEAWGGYNYTPAGLWDVQSVEVLRGPQSTSQGTNAIGGAVVIKTNDPSFTPESAVRLGLEQYDNDNLKYNLAGMNSGALIDDELAYRITFSGTKGEGWMNYDTSSVTDAPDLNDSESTSFQGKLLWTPSNIKGLTAKLNISHRENEGEYLSWASDTSTQTLDLDGDNTRIQDSTVDTVSFDIDYQISDTVKNILQVSYSKQDSYFEQYSSVTNVKRTEETMALENRVLFTPSNSKITSLLGFYAAQTDTTLDVETSWATHAYLGDGTTKTVALFGETSYDISDKLTVTAGGRIHNETQDRALVKTNGIGVETDLDQDTTETEFLPSLSTTYDISKTTTLGASVRRGYNSGGTGLDFSNNYFTYDKEEVTAYELSSKSRFNNISVNASVFYNDYSGYQAAENGHIYNLEGVYTYGAELEVVAQINPDLEINGSIGTLKTKINETSSDTSDWDGNEVTYAPDLNLGLGFTQFVGEHWSFGADATYVSEYYSDLDNDEEYTAGDYIVTNTRIKYELDNLTIDAYIKNITNEDIVYLSRSTTSSIGQSRTIGISATYRM